MELYAAQASKSQPVPGVRTEVTSPLGNATEEDFGISIPINYRIIL
jgi:hypothetical protein